MQRMEGQQVFEMLLLVSRRQALVHFEMIYLVMKILLVPGQQINH